MSEKGRVTENSAHFSAARLLPIGGRGMGEAMQAELSLPVPVEVLSLTAATKATRVAGIFDLQ